MRVLMVAGGEYYQAPMLNADTNRENNPIYIALGHAYKQPLIHILYRKIYFYDNLKIWWYSLPVMIARMQEN